MRQIRKLRQLVMAHIQPDHVTNPRDRKRRQTTVATTDVQAVGKVTLRAGDDGERQQPAQQDNAKASEHGDVTVRLQDGPAASFRVALIRLERSGSVHKLKTAPPLRTWLYLPRFLSLLGLCVPLLTRELLASPPSKENNMVVTPSASLLHKSGYIFLSLSITALPSLPLSLALKLTSSSSFLTSNRFSAAQDFPFFTLSHRSSQYPCLQK